MLQKILKKIKEDSGLAQIPLILGLLLMAVAIPVVMKLTQQQQDLRNRAAVHMCDAGQRACCDGTQYQVCSADGMNWSSCISCGTGNICTGSGNCGPRPTSVPSCTGTYGCIDPSQCQTTTSGSCDAGLVCCSEREPYPTHFPSPTNTPRPLTPTLTKRPSPTPTCVPVGGSASHVSECCSGRRSDGICVGYSCNGSCKPSGPGEDCRNYNLISGSGSCPDGQMCCKAGPTPTLEPRCATTFDKPTGCYCVLNAHCASNNCAGFVCVSALTPTPIPTSPVSSSCNPLQDTYRCSGNNLQQCTDNVGIGIWTHLDNCCSPSFSGCGCDSTSKRCKPAPTSTPRPGITILPTVIPGGNCTKNAYTTQCIDNGSCAGNGGVCVTVGTGCACHTGVTVTPPREGDCECEGGYYTGATCGILLDKPCGTATPTSTPREGDCECVDGYYEGNTCGTLLDKPCGTATVTPSEGSCVYPKYGVPGNCVMCKTGGPCSSNKECCSGECGVDQRCVPYNPVSTPPNGTTPAVYATPTNVPTQPNPQSECWCEDVCMSDSNCRWSDTRPGNSWVPECAAYYCRYTPSLTPPPATATPTPVGTNCGSKGGRCGAVCRDGEKTLNDHYNPGLCSLDRWRCCVPENYDGSCESMGGRCGAVCRSGEDTLNSSYDADVCPLDRWRCCKAVNVTPTKVPVSPGPTSPPATPVPTSTGAPPPPPGPGPGPGDDCDYDSLQARVQLNSQVDWITQLTVEKGEKVNLGCMHDGTGVLAGNVKIVAQHPEEVYEFNTNLQSEWEAPRSGNYTVYCQSLEAGCNGLTSSTNAILKVNDGSQGMCKECPNDFACYGHPQYGYAWFATSYEMEGYDISVNLYCEEDVGPKPVWLGKRRGDADCNGKIDGRDYSVWRREYVDISGGEAVARDSWEADFTGPEGVCDGIVDGYDYSLWRRSYIDVFGGDN